MYGIKTAALISLVLKYSSLPLEVEKSFISLQW